MWISIVAFLYSLDILTLRCSGLSIDNLPIKDHSLISKYHLSNNPKYVKPFLPILRNSSNDANKENEHKNPFENPGSITDSLQKIQQEQERNLKNKIASLVDQTIHDTKIRIESIQYLKDQHKLEIHYRVGFLLCMIKKSRDMLNELFHVAVKHRDDWKALEEMKILELIVHTNVDTTNLVKELAELHAHNPANKTMPSIRTKGNSKNTVDLS